MEQYFVLINNIVHIILSKSHFTLILIFFNLSFKFSKTFNNCTSNGLLMGCLCKCRLMLIDLINSSRIREKKIKDISSICLI